MLFEKYMGGIQYIKNKFFKLIIYSEYFILVFNKFCIQLNIFQWKKSSRAPLKTYLTPKSHFFWVMLFFLYFFFVFTKAMNPNNAVS